MNPQLLAKLLPLLAKYGRLGIGAAKAHPFASLLTGAYGVSTAESMLGERANRKLAKAEIDAKAALEKASIDAGQKLLEESRKSKKEDIAALTAMRAEEIRREREQAMLESFTQSQDRQMALLMQAVQAATQRPAVGPPVGRLGIMRGAY